MNLKQLSIVAVIASFAAPLMAEEHMTKDNNSSGMNAVQNTKSGTTDKPADGAAMAKDDNAGMSKPGETNPVDNPQPGNSSPQTTDASSAGKDNTLESNQDSSSKSIYGY